MSFLTAKKKLRRSDDQNAKLNITSMMDMFTIILIFLLKSYSVNPVNINPQDNMRLPSSSSKTAPIEAVNLVVMQDKLVLEKDAIIPLQDGLIEKKYLARDGKTISLLSSALKKELKKSNYLEEKNSKYKFKGTIIVQSDKAIPFKTLKKVMYTTGVSGYTDFRFAVINNE